MRPNRSATIAQIGPKIIRAALPIAFSRPSSVLPSPKAVMICGKNVLETPPSELSMAMDAPSATVPPRRPFGATKSDSWSVSSPSRNVTPAGEVAARSSVPGIRMVPGGVPSGR